MTKLWRRVEVIRTGRQSHLVHDWRCERDCDIETASEWLAVFQRAQPDQVFRLSPTKPRCTRVEA